MGCDSAGIGLDVPRSEQEDGGYVAVVASDDHTARGSPLHYESRSSGSVLTSSNLLDTDP